MAEFLLSDDAALDMQYIYRQGLERFGQAQADKYLNELFDLFDLLATTPNMGTMFDVQGAAYRRHPHKAHVLVFEPLENATGVKILRVFYGASDYFRQL